LIRFLFGFPYLALLFDRIIVEKSWLNVVTHRAIAPTLVLGTASGPHHGEQGKEKEWDKALHLFCHQPFSKGVPSGTILILRIPILTRSAMVRWGDKYILLPLLLTRTTGGSTCFLGFIGNVGVVQLIGAAAKPLPVLSPCLAAANLRSIHRKRL